MKPVRAHKRMIIPARLIGLMLMVALLAHPALGMVFTTTGCSDQCSCCPDTGHEPTPTIRSISDTKSDCCAPSASAPCHMSAGSLPATPLLLIQTSQQPPIEVIHLLLNKSNPAIHPQSCKPPIAWIDTDPERHPPLYLKTCRLIC